MTACWVNLPLARGLACRLHDSHAHRAVCQGGQQLLQECGRQHAVNRQARQQQGHAAGRIWAVQGGVLCTDRGMAQLVMLEA